MSLPVTSEISEIGITENLANEFREEEEQRCSACQATSSALDMRGWKSRTSLLQDSSTGMMTISSKRPQMEKKVGSRQPENA